MADSKWNEAMKEKMKALTKNEMWELVASPEDNKLVDCKWVFTVKHKLMVPLKGSKQDWWLKDSIRLMEWIIQRHFPLLQK